MSKVTCRYCKKKVDKEQAFSKKPRVYFCNKECYDAYYHTDEGELETFLDYVWAQYSPEARNNQKYVMIKKQAEHYHDVYGFKYKGMYLTAKWYIETLEQPWKDEYGLGQILPDRYNQLKEYYEEKRRLRFRVKPNGNKERIAKGNIGVRRRKMLEI
jgi:hypothetical protein